jgi:hypothetical protein
MVRGMRSPSLVETQDEKLPGLAFPGSAWGLDDEPLDSRGDECSVNDLEHGYPVCTRSDCGETMSNQAVMQVTRSAGGITDARVGADASSARLGLGFRREIRRAGARPTRRERLGLSRFWFEDQALAGSAIHYYSQRSFEAEMAHATIFLDRRS